MGEAFVKELTQYAVDLQRVQVIKPGTDPHQFAEVSMPTYSPEQALARPRPRCGEGLLAAAVAAGRSVYWPDAGRRWPFSEGWALAQFTGLLLALSYRYWRARGARVLHAGKWLALLPVLLLSGKG